MELRYVDDVHSDIEFTTAHLAIHMSAPTVALQKEANQLLSYLAGTTRHSLRIAPTSNRRGRLLRHSSRDPQALWGGPISR